MHNLCNDYDVPFNGSSVVEDNQIIISRCIPIVVTCVMVVGAIPFGARWCISVSVVVPVP